MRDAKLHIPCAGTATAILATLCPLSQAAAVLQVTKYFFPSQLEAGFSPESVATPDWVTSVVRSTAWVDFPQECGWTRPFCQHTKGFIVLAFIGQ